MTNEEKMKIEALRTVSAMASAESCECSDKGLYEDADRANSIANWCDDRVEAIERADK